MVDSSTILTGSRERKLWSLFKFSVLEDGGECTFASGVGIGDLVVFVGFGGRKETGKFGKSLFEPSITGEKKSFGVIHSIFLKVREIHPHTEVIRVVDLV